jgi:hypothetical protein
MRNKMLYSQQLHAMQIAKKSRKTHSAGSIPKPDRLDWVKQEKNST